ncbi:diacylglycerol/lipid kinase family protein [Actinomadura flavalba]|uniref:diacylglycerol/lipid kinase family protein n=1 Tax=Actinomadura flavalba TaxID=1120938 RepID=UPI000376F2D6|nr:diacylglycerol kinase family protein [Actinomadura flavalba]
MRSKPELEAAIRDPDRCNAVLVVNVESRSGRRQSETAQQALQDAGLGFSRVIEVTDPEKLDGILAELAEEAPDLVVVGGGDGTIAAAVGHFAHRDIALGVLPFGTTNNFARGLELPLDVRGAVGVLRDGKVADVDVGSADGHIFANMVSVGLSVHVAEQVPHKLKRVLGRSAYGLTAAWLLLRHKPFTATCELGDETLTLTTHQLNVANGGHQSGQRIARDAGPDDRLLALYRLGDRRRVRLAAATVRHVLTGQWRSLNEEQFTTTRDVRITTDPPTSVDVDGEVRGQTPVHIKLHGNALRVLVPQSFVDT